MRQPSRWLRPSAFACRRPRSRPAPVPLDRGRAGVGLTKTAALHSAESNSPQNPPVPGAGHLRRAHEGGAEDGGGGGGGPGGGAYPGGRRCIARRRCIAGGGAYPAEVHSQAEADTSAHPAAARSRRRVRSVREASSAPRPPWMPSRRARNWRTTAQRQHCDEQSDETRNARVHENPHPKSSNDFRSSSRPN